MYFRLSFCEALFAPVCVPICFDIDMQKKTIDECKDCVHQECVSNREGAQETLQRRRALNNTHKHTRFELEGSSSVDGWPIPAHHHHHQHHQNPSHADDRDDGGDAANNLRPFVINFYCSIQLVSKRGPQGLVVMPGERVAASAQHQRRWHDAGVKGTCARAREMCLLLSRAREKNGPNRPASECASDSPQVTLERAAALFVYWSKNGATSLLATLALLHCLRSVFFHHDCHCHREGGRVRCYRRTHRAGDEAQ